MAGFLRWWFGSADLRDKNTNLKIVPAQCGEDLLVMSRQRPTRWARKGRNMSDIAATTWHRTRKELAERLKCSERTVERMELAGTGPRFLRIGSRVLYPMAEIERWEHARLRASRADELAAQ